MSLFIKSGLSFLKPIFPPGYVGLEYIESTGTQYINTGIKPSSDMTFEIEYQVMVNTTKGQKLFGCEAKSSSLFDAFSVKKASAAIRAFAHSSRGGIVTNINTKPDQKTKLKLDIKNGKYTVSVNDNSYQPVAANGTIPNLDIYLFAVNRLNTSTGETYADVPISAKIYCCRIYKSGALVGDFRPALNTDFVAGMYDMVGGEFHGNLGTGEFITQFSSTETASVMSLRMNDDEVDLTDENYDGGAE